MAGVCPEEFVAFAGRLADAAGAAIRPHFRTAFTVDTKGDTSPVTVADRAAEAAMRAMIEASYPDHGIYGEEFGIVRGDAEHLWILDPIDGTKSFVAGLPVFGTLIALGRRGEALLGVIDQPVLGERWIGARGRPTTLNGRNLRTRPCAALAEAVVYSTSVDLFTPAQEAAFARLRRAVRVHRLAGDCYAYGLVAGGWADLVVESQVKPYDFAALIPVLEGAGGRITDWAGAPLALDRPAPLVAAGDARLHSAAIEFLGSQPQN
jgi:inositol-phosphate phosphatase/L-galactose 1-phosphate phosphatase/histidinol-phosphatase